MRCTRGTRQANLGHPATIAGVMPCGTRLHRRERAGRNRLSKITSPDRSATASSSISLAPVNSASSPMHSPRRNVAASLSVSDSIMQNYSFAHIRTNSVNSGRQSDGRRCRSARGQCPRTDVALRGNGAAVGHVGGDVIGCGHDFDGECHVGDAYRFVDLTDRRVDLEHVVAHGH